MRASCLRAIIVLAVFCIGITACEQAEIKENMRKVMRDPIDREGDITYKEFKNTLRPGGSANKRQQQDSDLNPDAHKDDEEELDFAPVLLPPEEPEIKSGKVVSLSITPDIKIKDVLLEVGRQAKLDMAIDPKVEGGIYLSVKDKPVGDVIKMICDLANLKYETEDSVVRISLDRPYLENYAVDIMNLSRSTSGTVTTNTNVTGITSSGSGGSGLNSGSTNKIELESKGDLWKSIDDNLKEIINLQSLAVVAEGEVVAAGQGNNLSANQNALNANQNTQGSNQSAAQPARSSTAATSTSPEDDIEKGSYYTINRQAGIITVNATQKKHRIVRKYLDQIKRFLSAQVLIEAKILEVNLAEEFGSGISWQDLAQQGKTVFSASGNTEAGSKSSLTSPSLNGIFGNVLTLQGKDPLSKPRLAYIVNAIQQYGTIRTLSNPRITALNNQQAVLTFALNKLFYQVTVEAGATTTNSTGASTVSAPTLTTEAKSVPIGVLLAIYPLIHIDSGEITLNIRPTISRDTGNVIKDPAISYAAGQLTANATSATSEQTKDIVAAIVKNDLGTPVIEVRELDTVLKIKSGDVVVLGGLIEHRDQNTDSGIPFLSKIPILGNLAKKTYKTTSVKETVILLQATILGSDGYTHEHDRNMYRTFAQDPRPLTF